MGNCCSNSVSSDDYRHPQHYPMWVLRVATLLQMEKMFGHQELKSANLLMEHRPSFFTIFVSHQWLSPSHPDPAGQQFAILQQAVENIIHGRAEMIQSSLTHQMAGHVCRMSSQQRKRVKNGFVWMDWFSVPQISEGICRETRRCVKSIPFYVEASKVFVTLAPSLRNAKGEVCNYSTYLTRGWCRAEMWCKVLANASGQIPIVTVAGEERLEFSEPIGWMRNPVHAADFTVEADRHEVTEILRIALDGRLAMLKATSINEYRYLLSRYERYLGLMPPQRTPEEFLSHFAFDNLQKAVTSNSVSGLVCATLSGDLSMMRYLVKARASVDAKVPEMLEFDVLQHCRVIHLAATQGSPDESPLLELLTLRANCNAAGPFGAPALGHATTRTAVQLLVQFRAEVNICEQFEKVAPLAAACGRAAPTEVICELLQQKADVNLRTGGVGLTPLMALALFESRNIYTLEHLALLINAKADIHQPGEPEGMFYWSQVFCRGYLRLRKLPWPPPVKLWYISHLSSTPLHIACMAGSSQLAESLMDLRADPHRKNKNGFSPLDLTRDTSFRKLLEKPGESHLDVVSI